jgi:hypothetical protein
MPYGTRQKTGSLPGSPGKHLFPAPEKGLTPPRQPKKQAKSPLKHVAVEDVKTSVEVPRPQPVMLEKLSEAQERTKRRDLRKLRHEIESEAAELSKFLVLSQTEEEGFEGTVDTDLSDFHTFRRLLERAWLFTEIEPELCPTVCDYVLSSDSAHIPMGVQAYMILMEIENNVGKNWEMCEKLLELCGLVEDEFKRRTDVFPVYRDGQRIMQWQHLVNLVTTWAFGMRDLKRALHPEEEPKVSSLTETPKAPRKDSAHFAPSPTAARYSAPLVVAPTPTPTPTPKSKNRARVHFADEGGSPQTPTKLFGGTPGHEQELTQPGQMSRDLEERPKEKKTILRFKNFGKK